jgi:outer membrane protein assembly factor BamD
MPEAAEAQNRVCQIHYRQMDKSDRDITQTLRAEDECRTLLVQYPNSKFAPETAQTLRNIQESLAEHEFVVGNFYWKREMNPAAANRLNALVDQYPLYSRADEALFEAGDAYEKMGPRFRRRAGEMFARIVEEYPLGSRAADAKARLEDLELPVPQADPRAVARMKYEKENYRHPGLIARSTGFIRSAPDVSHAAKVGSPTMTDPKKTIPASIPVPVNPDATAGGSGTGSGTTEVTASANTSSAALDNRADARQTVGTAQSATAGPTQGALPTNRDKELARLQKARAKKLAQMEKKAKKKQKSSEDAQANPQAPATQNAAGPNGAAPASAATPAAASSPTAPPQ